VTDEYGLSAWPLAVDADLVALRESERELGWLWAEVSRERVPATDPAAWRGRAASALGHRLVELSYFLDEAARHLESARDAVERTIASRVPGVDG